MRDAQPLEVAGLLEDLEKLKEEKVQYSKGSQYGITRGASYYGGGR